MKKLLIISFVLFAWHLNAQVGIGTNTPDNSAMLEIQANDRGILFPRLTSAQRSSIPTPAAGLYVFDTNTKSLWYYNGALWINTVAESTLGDMKSGFQSADHSGWIKLDGRAISTLSTNQQAVAVSLGFTTNLPDASSAYPVQNTGTLGAVVGANTTTLTQANLPNVSFTGTAANAGAHTHNTDPAAINSGYNGDHAHSGTTSTNGFHSHGSNAGGGQGGLGLVYSNGYNTVINTDNSNGELNVWTNPYGLSIYGDGNHNHTFGTSTNGGHTHTVDIPSTTSSSDGTHSHAVSVASGGTATPINIAPKSLIVNMFIYLGQ
jgi:microcystin-dependent protein